MLRQAALTCAVAGYVVAQKAGSIVETGDTLVSAMMVRASSSYLRGISEVNECTLDVPG
jgi:hypothetical protein